MVDDFSLVYYKFTSEWFFWLYVVSGKAKILDDWGSARFENGVYFLQIYILFILFIIYLWKYSPGYAEF